MGVVLPRDTTLRGLPARIWKVLMQVWTRSNERIWNLGNLKALGLDPYETAALLDEAEHQHLIIADGHWHRDRTGKGDALKGARIGAKQPRAKAERLLQEILGRAEAINADPTLPFRVETILLYGSLLDPAVTEVSDLDVHVTTARLGQWDAVKDRYAQLDGFATADDCDLYWHPEYVERRLIFGDRKHPLLGKDLVSNPIQYGFRHRCVFDAARGGCVTDPDIPENPNAPYRENLKPRIGDVSFRPSPMRSVNAKWFAQTCYIDQEDPRYGPWVGTRDHYFAISKSRLSLTFLARPDDPVARRYSALAEHPALHETDGRKRTALVVTGKTPAGRRGSEHDTFLAAFILTRQIETIGGVIVHTTRLVDLITPGIDGVNEIIAEEVRHAQMLLAWGIHALATADRHLIGMIDADDPRPFEEWFENGLPATATGFLAGELRHDLEAYLPRSMRCHARHPASPTSPGHLTPQRTL